MFLPAPLLADPLETAEKAAGEWVKLKVETARIESAWEEERSLVESMTAALKSRADMAEEKRDLAQAQTARERDELDALRSKSTSEAEDLKVLDRRLREISAQIIALRPSLPPRLSDALEMPCRSLTATELPSGERMQLVMVVLNRCAEFNRVVTLGDDVLTLEGEPAPKSLDVLYWGLSHGYALDRGNRKAWIGSPDAGAWRWQPLPENYDAVSDLFAIARDTADPAFVPVPARVARNVGNGRSTEVAR